MDKENTTYTQCSLPAPKPLSLQEMTDLMSRHEDRMPAPVKAIKVHPAYYSVFIATLRQKGFQSLQEENSLIGIPVYKDESVRFGEWERVYEITLPEMK